MSSSARAVFFSNPIRLSGILALTVLAGPGSLTGLASMLAHAGADPLLPMVEPRLHGLLQLAGFFLILIWGFLTHGLPGMIGANLAHTRLIRIPMVALTAGVLSIWAGEAFALGAEFTRAAWVFTALVAVSGTGLLLVATLMTKRRWLERPFPLLLVPFLVSPVPVVILAAQTFGAWMPVRAGDFLLYASVIPIILAMGYRMFPAMSGLKLPRERVFDAAAVAWGIGTLGRLTAPLTPVAVLAGDLGLALGAVLFAVALGAFEPRRRTSSPQFAGYDRALRLYLRVAFLFLVAGPLVSLVGDFDLAAGVSFYWQDLGRHLMALGFAGLVVMGITQRMYPVFLRGRRGSIPWMYLNLALVSAGLALRATEPFLPATGSWVQASAWVLYAGIVSYALHLVRGMFFPSAEPPSPIRPVRPLAKRPPAARAS